ncbi:putative spindle assembly checkpoint component [Clavispora lusitaniae]|uniref:Spindle assembly checkpoint component MAD1 n=1 Tax=Clavispora lusitaniae TaxID=36911 RepID=A0AA91Q4X7_CLALS|nr:putative spindle assembly checkpoint component [Clavispora lusitaniae]
MIDGSSSPFLESPGTPVFREKLARLEYEVSTLKTEKRLLQQNKDSSIGRYEELLAKKNDELARLQSNFDYVYNQRNELKSKLENQKDVAGRNTSDLTKDTKRLREENDALRKKLDKYERQYTSVSGKLEHVRADLNRELSANDQYRERIGDLEQENKQMADLNKDLLERMKSLSAQIENNRAASQVEELQLKLSALQNTNNSLQSKVDSLLQAKTSVELLKQKNASMAARIQVLEAFEEKAASLELDNVKLQAKFDEYFGAIASSVEKQDTDEENTVVSFISNFKQLQNRNLVLFDKLNETQSKVTELEQLNNALTSQIEQELQPQLEQLKAANSAAETEIAELKKIKILNGKEIEFLRNSLKDMDTVASRKSVAETNPDSLQEQEAQRKATNQYLTNLEKLVDDYKNQIDELTKKENTKQITMPSKRPRLAENSADLQTVRDLRNENLELSATIKGLKDEIESLRKRLALKERNPSSKGNILELRLNPFAKDQYVKQETLDLLRKENEALITQYVKNGNVDYVPKSVFARQENDKDILQAKIDQLSKKLNRLKNVYTEKSKEILAIISRFFGYVIEFIPSPINSNDFCSKIKLVSKYMIQKDKEQSPPYLILDVQSKSLKANGNYEFKTMCEELVSQWVNDKHQIPCFLSALNLKIFEDYKPRDE